jgi:hypothetical protein
MWLLKSILGTPWLQQEFMYQENIVTGNQNVCQDYRLPVDAFLERLLLLIYLTAGQSVYGSETSSLRYINAVNGHYGNIAKARKLRSLR